MDFKSFSNNNFDPKEWLNNIYKSSNKDENKQIFVHNTLNALQLYIQQLNNALEETTSQVISSMPRVIGESKEIEASAKELQLHADNLKEALTAAQQAAGHPLLTLQRTDRLKAKLEAARQELQESDKWASLASKLESALESANTLELSSVTKILDEMNDCLGILSESSDYEDKRLQLEGLKNRLEAVLSPAVVEAFTSQKTEKCKEFWKLFITMGRKNALSVYRARCEDGALRARIPSGIINLSPSLLRDLHTILLRHAAHQLEWAPIVCPGEETLPWLIRLYSSVLTEISNVKQLEEFESKNGSTASAQLDQLAELIAACDHFISEINTIINNEQGRMGLVPENDLSEFAYVVYAPVRNNLNRLNRLLVAAMTDDMGPFPVIEPQNSDLGTTLQLRIVRSSRTLISRMDQGKILSRGAAPQHLLYAIQWLIDELCSGWTAVNNLAGCLSLMKAAGQLQNLVLQADNILKDSEENTSLQKYKNLPSVLRDWEFLLKPNFTPIISLSPLSAGTDKLCTDLKQKALELVLSPITQYLDFIGKIQGWSNNDQHSLDLPDFSLSPQEYITQVGQYLMNLPQHLEPLLERGEISSTDEDAAYQFLNEVCNSACEMFVAKINAIQKMDALGVRKCITDIAYLSSVLEELEAGAAGVQMLSELIAQKQIL